LLAIDNRPLRDDAIVCAVLPGVNFRFWVNKKPHVHKRLGHPKNCEHPVA